LSTLLPHAPLPVDPRSRTRAAKLGLRTLADALFYLPLRYEDLRAPVPVATLREGMEALVRVRVLRHKEGQKTVRLECADPDSGAPLTLVFFQRLGWVRNAFHAGTILTLRGKVQWFRGEPEIAQPEMLDGGDLGKIRPVYPKVAGVSQQWVRDLMARVLEAIDDWNLAVPPGDTAPGLPSLAQALQTLHRPDDLPLSGAVLEALKVWEIRQVLQTLKAQWGRAPSGATPLVIADKALQAWREGRPFTLTQAQERAIAEVRTDLEQERPMRRLVVGDVGSGKTQVILAASLIAAQAGGRSAVMLPTGILAEQIFEEVAATIPEAALITRTEERGAPLDRAKVVVGTHALLHRDLPPLNLVVIDEQHRFGTQQRQQLLERHPGAHALQLSATPIPRTMGLFLSQALSLSVIDQAPVRRAIATQVLARHQLPSMFARIEAEIALGHQVFVIYPTIEGGEEDVADLKRGHAWFAQRYPGQVEMTFGRDPNKEVTLRRMRREEFQILVTTSVVEVGISLPKLTVVAISGAERMGLATLHQLRGRLARAGLPGWFYLHSHTDEEVPRLRLLEETLDGFAIAEQDMKLRGWGDLISGLDQSGQHLRFFKPQQDLHLLDKVIERG